MSSKKTRRFYILSVMILLILSAYPLINGIRLIYFSFVNGVIEADQLAGYIIPYAAISVSVLLFAALHPLFIKLKRYAFPVGITAAFGIFFAVERFFESLQVKAAGMVLMNYFTLAPEAVEPSATLDMWQAFSCVASPVMLSPSPSYYSMQESYYVLNNNFYKIHYYLISLIMIVMVCSLMHGIAKWLRVKEPSGANLNEQETTVYHTQKIGTEIPEAGLLTKSGFGSFTPTGSKPLFMRGISTAVLLALCIFANTTSFFRQAAPIQTPLASVLTCLFFVLLGSVVGIYIGSYLMDKGIRLGVYMPVIASLSITILMYVGEALMMSGNLYRFGIGWFFNGLPGIILAPVDVIVVALSGLLTWFILRVTRK